MTEPIPTVSARRTPLWLWVMLTLFALSVLIVTSAFQWIVTLDHLPAQVIIDGQEILSVDPAWFSGWTSVAVIASAVVCVFTLLVLVPLVLLFALACALIGMALGVVLPLAAVALALVLVFSPLWLLGFIAWRLVKRSTPRGMAAA